MEIYIVVYILLYTSNVYNLKMEYKQNDSARGGEHRRHRRHHHSLLHIHAVFSKLSFRKIN